MNFYAKFRQYIFCFKYLKKSRDQLEMMNALLDKISFRLRIVYDNLLKLSKTLKEIKTYFTRVNNRHKVTRKIRKKEKTQKIDRAVRSHILKRFVSFSSRPTYTPQFLVSSRRIIDYCK